MLSMISVERGSGDIDLTALPGLKLVLKNALGHVRYYEKSGISVHDSEHEKKCSFVHGQVHGQLDTLCRCAQRRGR